jgi:hypothetical protein
VTTLVDDVLKTGSQGAVFSPLKDCLFIRYNAVEIYFLLFRPVIYTSNDGESVVIVVKVPFSGFIRVLYSLRLSSSYLQQPSSQVHLDDSPPYYTIQFPDGKCFVSLFLLFSRFSKTFV